MLLQNQNRALTRPPLLRDIQELSACRRAPEGKGSVPGFLSFSCGHHPIFISVRHTQARQPGLPMPQCRPGTCAPLSHPPGSALLLCRRDPDLRAAVPCHPTSVYDAVVRLVICDPRQNGAEPYRASLPCNPRPARSVTTNIHTSHHPKAASSNVACLPPCADASPGWRDRTQPTRDGRWGPPLLRPTRCARSSQTHPVSCPNSGSKSCCRHTTPPMPPPSLAPFHKRQGRRSSSQ